MIRDLLLRSFYLLINFHRRFSHAFNACNALGTLVGDTILKRPRNWFSFAAVVLLWSGSWTAGKDALSYVGPLNLVLHRYLVSAIALSPLLILLRKKIPREKDNVAKLLLLGVTNVSSVICTTIALVSEPSGMSAVLTYTQPLFVFCLSALFLTSEVQMGRLLGALVGFCGVILLSMTKSRFFEILPYSAILLLVGAFLWAVAIIYYKKSLSHIDPVVTETNCATLNSRITRFYRRLSTQSKYLPCDSCELWPQESNCTPWRGRFARLDPYT